MSKILQQLNNVRIGVEIGTLIFLFNSLVFGGVTGKIVGKVTDAETGIPLSGTNIVLQGKTMGAASDVDGNYVILNVPPGKYELMASMIGYTDVTIADVRVEIDLTTTINIALQSEVLLGEAVTVQAERKPVRVDVAASQRSVSSDEIEQLPVSTIEGIIGLQAGISGFQIRGGGEDQTQFVVDGIVMNDERTNEPTKGIPLSSIQDISIQTGGFNPEYHNVRSGVVNVVTKEGPKDHYTATVQIRYSPPAQKHFGLSPYDYNSFWLRPYLDPDVMWTGTTNGAWDEYTQRQYPEFVGWYRISEQSMEDDDPSNDLTPTGAMRVFTWDHRKNGAIQKPDVNIDAGFGGPVPVLSKSLGNLRFYTSIYSDRDMYLYELSRPGVEQNTMMTKLTSDISNNTKLSMTYIRGKILATTASRGGGTAYMENEWDLASAVNRSGFTMPWRLFTNLYWSPTTINNSTISARLSHQINQNSFYRILIKHDVKRYHTWHGEERDSTFTKEVVPGYFVSEAPVGFYGPPLFSLEGRLAFGGAVSTSRDTSVIKTFTIRGDYTNQINMHHEIKSGVEFVYNDLLLEFGSENAFLPLGNYWSSVHQFPYRIHSYGQDKLEFEGFVATVGLNLDYVNTNGKWYDVDVYAEDFYSSSFNPAVADTFPMKKIKPQVTWSPRLAVSHPITEDSKLYFNYGHYRQMPIQQSLYRIRRGPNNEAWNMGDPTLPLARTISYELGYDQALKNQYILHLAAYYKDVTNQQDLTDYISADDKVNYSQLTANSYEDIRGFEVDISKIRGRWLTGMINYEYRVSTSGFFDIGVMYQDRKRMRDYLQQNPQQSKPVPQPRIKSVVDFHTPYDLKPRLLADWRLNFISRWTAGRWFTYNPLNKPKIQYNVQYRDNYSFDIKLSKTFTLGKTRLKFFVDVYNVFNIKTFSGYGFYDTHDYNNYMQSLHMPEEIVEELGYHSYPGKDRPGVYRESDVEFIPMEWINDHTNISEPSERAVYYEFDEVLGDYLFYKYEEGEWVLKAENWVEDNVLEPKAYIDMPNISSYVFLAPRDVFIGLNFSFDI